jgi:predicted aconitase with swiveling domain
MKTMLHGRKVVGGKARGAALVTDEPICFLGGVDVNTGKWGYLLDATERKM